MRRRLAFGALFIAITLTSTGARADECDAPKPDLKISPAIEASSAKDFAGVWAGTWLLTVKFRRESTRDTLCAKLYVSVKDDHTASVAYCVGSLKTLGRSPVCYSANATISGTVLRFETSTGSVLSFTRTGHDTLTAQAQGRNGTSQAEFSKSSL